jgi:DNA-binding FrmR family transcriptional regulator
MTKRIILHEGAAACLSGDAHAHPDHSAQLKALARVGGQIEGVKRMIVERRYCPDILTQIAAARAALKSVEAKIFEAHVRACVHDVVHAGTDAERTEKIEEIAKLYKERG